MSTIFTPTVTEAETTETVVTHIAAKLNLPLAGTLMRATLGNTVIEFRLPKDQIHNPRNLFVGCIEGEGHDGFLNFQFWHEIPWSFEILDELQSTETEHTFEDTLAEVAAFSAENQLVSA